MFNLPLIQHWVQPEWIKEKVGFHYIWVFSYLYTIQELSERLEHLPISPFLLYLLLYLYTVGGGIRTCVSDGWRILRPCSRPLGRACISETSHIFLSILQGNLVTVCFRICASTLTFFDSYNNRLNTCVSYNATKELEWELDRKNIFLPDGKKFRVDSNLSHWL